ncbi:MAG: hypothetical protein NNA20_00005, partial [Nitrospira sp.]|nr:hypothetical protein [Nitrospira sp.]
VTLETDFFGKGIELWGGACQPRCSINKWLESGIVRGVSWSTQLINIEKVQSGSDLHAEHEINNEAIQDCAQKQLIRVVNKALPVSQVRNLL